MSIGGFGLDWQGTYAVIVMPAEIDVTNSGQAGRALLAALGQQPAVLVIDMTQTTFCDSTGVAALVDAHRQAGKGATQLMLVAPGVERILELTGFGQMIPMYPTLDAAYAAAAPGSQA